MYHHISVLMVNISNDRLIIQNALLNHADDDIKKEMAAKLDLEIKLLSGKFTTGDKENGKEKSSRKNKSGFDTVQVS